MAGNNTPNGGFARYWNLFGRSRKFGFANEPDFSLEKDPNGNNFVDFEQRRANDKYNEVISAVTAGRDAFVAQYGGRFDDEASAGAFYDDFTDLYGADGAKFGSCIHGFRELPGVAFERVKYHGDPELQRFNDVRRKALEVFDVPAVYGYESVEDVSNLLRRIDIHVINAQGDFQQIHRSFRTLNMIPQQLEIIADLDTSSAAYRDAKATSIDCIVEDYVRRAGAQDDYSLREDLYHAQFWKGSGWAEHIRSARATDKLKDAYRDVIAASVGPAGPYRFARNYGDKFFSEVEAIGYYNAVLSSKADPDVAAAQWDFIYGLRDANLAQLDNPDYAGYIAKTSQCFGVAEAYGYRDLEEVRTILKAAEAAGGYGMSLHDLETFDENDPRFADMVERPEYNPDGIRSAQNYVRQRHSGWAPGLGDVANVTSLAETYDKRKQQELADSLAIQLDEDGRRAKIAASLSDEFEANSGEKLARPKKKFGLPFKLPKLPKLSLKREKPAADVPDEQIGELEPLQLDESVTSARSARVDMTNEIVKHAARDRKLRKLNSPDFSMENDLSGRNLDELEQSRAEEKLREIEDIIRGDADGFLEQYGDKFGTKEDALDFYGRFREAFDGRESEFEASVLGFRDLPGDIFRPDLEDARMSTWRDALDVFDIPDIYGYESVHDVDMSFLFASSLMEIDRSADAGSDFGRVHTHVGPREESLNSLSRLAMSEPPEGLSPSLAQDWRALAIEFAAQDYSCRIGQGKHSDVVYVLRDRSPVDGSTGWARKAFDADRMVSALEDYELCMAGGFKDIGLETFQERVAGKFESPDVAQYYFDNVLHDTDRGVGDAVHDFIYNFRDMSAAELTPSEFSGAFDETFECFDLGRRTGYKDLDEIRMVLKAADSAGLQGVGLRELSEFDPNDAKYADIVKAPGFNAKAIKSVQDFMHAREEGRIPDMGDASRIRTLSARYDASHGALFEGAGLGQVRQHGAPVGERENRAVERERRSAYRPNVRPATPEMPADDLLDSEPVAGSSGQGYAQATPPVGGRGQAQATPPVGGQGQAQATPSADRSVGPRRRKVLVNAEAVTHGPVDSSPSGPSGGSGGSSGPSGPSGGRKKQQTVEQKLGVPKGVTVEGSKTQQDYINDMMEQITKNKYYFATYQDDMKRWADPSYLQQRIDARNEAFCHNMVDYCIQPLKNGVSPSNIVDSIGLYVGMSVMSKEFRKHTQASVSKALFPVVEKFTRTRDSFAEHACKALRRGIDWTEKTTGMKVPFVPEDMKFFQFTTDSTDDRLNQHKEKFLRQLNNGRMPLTPDTFAMNYVSFVYQAYQKMQTIPQECEGLSDPDEKSKKSKERVDEITGQLNGALKTLYFLAEKDGIDRRDADTSVRVLVGTLTTQHPEMRNVFYETAAYRVERSRGAENVEFADGSAGYIWRGEYKDVRKSKKVGYDVAYESGFELRRPMTAAGHREMIGKYLTDLFEGIDDYRVIGRFSGTEVGVKVREHFLQLARDDARLPHIAKGFNAMRYTAAEMTFDKKELEGLDDKERRKRIGAKAKEIPLEQAAWLVALKETREKWEHDHPDAAKERELHVVGDNEDIHVEGTAEGSEKHLEDLEESLSSPVAADVDGAEYKDAPLENNTTVVEPSDEELAAPDEVEKLAAAARKIEAEQEGTPYVPGSSAESVISTITGGGEEFEGEDSGVVLDGDSGVIIPDGVDDGEVVVSDEEFVAPPPGQTSGGGLDIPVGTDDGAGPIDIDESGETSVTPPSSGGGNRKLDGNFGNLSNPSGLDADGFDYMNF